MQFHIYNYEQRGETEVCLHGKWNDSIDNILETIVVKNIVSDIYFLPTTHCKVMHEDELMNDNDESSAAIKLLKKEIMAAFGSNLKDVVEVERKNIFYKNFDKKLKFLKCSFYKKQNTENFESEYCDFILTEFNNPVEQLIISKRLMGCVLIEVDEKHIEEKKKVKFVNIDKINFIKAAKFKKLNVCSIYTRTENNKLYEYCYYDGKTSVVGKIVDKQSKESDIKNVQIKYFDNSTDVTKDLINLVESKSPDLILTHNLSIRKFVPVKKALLCDVFTFSQATDKGKDFSIKELCDKYHIECKEDDIIENTKSIYTLYDKMNILNLAREMSEISGFPINKCFMNSRAERIEYTMLHNLYDKMFLFPLPIRNHQEQKYTGGLVLEPARGYYTDIILLMDFNSLYPSIIQEFSVCFSTIDQLLKNEELDQKVNRIKPDEDMLFLPKILAQMVKRRKEVKKQMQNSTNADKIKQLDIRQKVLKLTANSIYGCLGFMNSRFCNFDMAAFITGKGREILSDTKDMAEKMDMKVIYGDTDSIMIHTKFPGRREYYNRARESVLELSKRVNNKYKHMVIELETAFSRLILYMKKKYAGLKFDMETSKIETKGLEIVRRDFSKVSSDLGMEMLKIIFEDSHLNSKKEEDIDVQKLYDKCLSYYNSLENVNADNFVISVVLGKELQFYGENSSLQHIVLGLRLKNKGILYKPGDVINYVMGISHDGSDKAVPYHINEKFTIDYAWYVKNQILPPLYRLLNPIKNIHMEKLALIFNNKDVIIPVSGALRELTFFSSCCDAVIDLKTKKCTKCLISIDRTYIKNKVLNLLINNNNHNNSIGTCVDCDRKYSNNLVDCYYCNKPLVFDFKNKEFDEILRNIEVSVKNTDLELEDVLRCYSEHSGYRKIDMYKYFSAEINRYNTEYK